VIKPWRDIAIPHQDVLKGTFQQSEFAADISQVQQGKTPPEYQDARQFFARTFITEGMALLLDKVIRRLAGLGGDPVIQLQTAFGGGKTHTLIAVRHLAQAEHATAELAGVPTLLDTVGVTALPRAGGGAGRHQSVPDHTQGARRHPGTHLLGRARLAARRGRRLCHGANRGRERHVARQGPAYRAAHGLQPLRDPDG